MRILCLTDYPMQPAGYRWIWDHLPEQRDEVDFLWRVTHDRSARWGKVLTRYPGYFYLASQALRRMSHDRYDLVVAWESKVGVPLALLRGLSMRNRPSLVILAFAPGYVPSVFLLLTRLALKGVAHLTVPSLAEMSSFERTFRVPQSRMSLCRLGEYDSLESARQGPVPVAGPTPYVHSGGRTARDFPTLVAAVRGLDVNVILHGRPYDLRVPDMPPNVQTADLAPKEQHARWVFHSLFEVVPLRPDVRHAAGLSQVVHAMMLGKAVVATGTPPVAEYVQDGVTGLLVEPGSASAMRSAILYLLEHREEAARMGRIARRQFEDCYTFDRFARRTHEILEGIPTS
jgi:hypothetical protein